MGSFFLSRSSEVLYLGRFLLIFLFYFGLAVVTVCLSSLLSPVDLSFSCSVCLVNPVCFYTFCIFIGAPFVIFIYEFGQYVCHFVFSVFPYHTLLFVSPLLTVCLEGQSLASPSSKSVLLCLHQPSSLSVFWINLLCFRILLSYRLLLNHCI